jgi:hypothetical protein
MSDRIQQRLNSEKSKKSVNTDTLVKINVESSERLLPTNEINKIVNVAERFNTERQRCKFYRIIGTINPLVSNTLFNLNDSLLFDKYTWAGFNSYDFLDSSYPQDGDVLDDGDLTYRQGINKYLKEKDGWFGYYDPNITASSLCNYFDMEPKRQRFSFLPDTKPFHGSTGQQPVKNWEITITYPYFSDKTHGMVYDTTNGSGLLIVEVVNVVVATRNMVAFGMPCLHNLVVGDTVRIVGTTVYDGDHTVIRTGLDNGDLKDYYFVIDSTNLGPVGNNSRMKKIVSGFETEYYFRKFKKIKTRMTAVIETDDYETYQAGFSENFFNDQIVQFVFNEDIDVTDLIDNLGRPLSEIYVSMIKTDSNGLFTNISSGIETPYIARLNSSDINTYLKDIPCINKIHNGGTSPFPQPFPSHNALETNVLVGNNDFYGDLVEYSISELKETTLASVSHRFNTKNREIQAPGFTYISNVVLNATQPETKVTDLGPRHEGYFYQPHHRIEIRRFSNYIEEGDINTVDTPSYAINLGDDRYLWRDLIDIGFNETDEKPLNYPFLNGAHYMYQNYCFHVRRQDQFAVWGLYYGDFPSDPVGDRITDKFIVNSVDSDVC